ncbi:glycerate kinase [Bacillus thermotolerans]|uniref:glycerate kinase n=1 Tax=Bacillus thermotolerans TaxID=1221996 RepID=UPI0005809DA3|nr:glycerate kinase [Bacillus thermotolerans]KKB37167.1 Glycerate kinase [Bacillus thermotolerans]KKB42595.1 Glycerate kinase [Bacillus thermotolerans]
MNILVVPSGFKECLNAERAADCIERGIKNTLPTACITAIPMTDGGEGFTETMVNLTEGELHYRTVTGPIGQKLEASIGILGDTKEKTAVIEMASAAGLRHVPRDHRNPLKTTTYGVGELIKAALDLEAERILIGCGDSGTSDGGIGMARALGVRFYDTSNQEIKEPGAERLSSLARIDMAGLDERIANVQIDAACNWSNVLCGSTGVARVFGPQKGAAPEQVECLEKGLEQYAKVIEDQFGIDMRQAPGSGASGGLGTGLQVLLGARLHCRYDVIFPYLHLDKYLQKADLVITAEGSIDGQTPNGKIPAEVGRRAMKRGIPVIALAGTIGRDASHNYGCGIHAYASILQKPVSLDEAFQSAEEWLTETTESMIRIIQVGSLLAEKQLRAGEVS